MNHGFRKKMFSTQDRNRTGTEWIDAVDNGDSIIYDVDNSSIIVNISMKKIYKFLKKNCIYNI